MDQLQADVEQCFIRVSKRRDWDMKAPNPDLILTPADAVGALAGIVRAHGMDPTTVLAGLLINEARRDPEAGRSWAVNGGGEQQPAMSWRDMVATVMREHRQPMTSGEIVARVAALRNTGSGHREDYRFVERCVGVVLSRHIARALDDKYKLSVVNPEQDRNRIYELVPLAKALPRPKIAA